MMRHSPILIIILFRLVEDIPARRRYFPSPLCDKKKAVTVTLSPTIFENHPGVTSGWNKNNIIFSTNFFQWYLYVRSRESNHNRVQKHNIYSQY